MWSRFFPSCSVILAQARCLLVGGALLFAAAGCGEVVPPGSTGAALSTLGAAYPEVWFRADWTIGLSAPLIGGQPALFRYDLSRQRGCRGSGWSVVASLAAPGHTPTVLYLPGTDRTGSLERYVSVPLDSDLSVWFQGRDHSGCQVWDSDFGRNFHFTPTLPERVIHLLSGFGSRVDGTLQAGMPFGVDFDLQRLPFCIARTADGRFTGVATMYHRFNGGPATATELLAPPPVVDGHPGGLLIAPMLTPPAGARTVELWFSASDAFGCTLWDSNYGANYRFEIAP